MNIDFPVMWITQLIRTMVVPISGVIGVTVVRIARNDITTEPTTYVSGFQKDLCIFFCATQDQGDQLVTSMGNDCNEIEGPMCVMTSFLADSQCHSPMGHSIHLTWYNVECIRFFHIFSIYIVLQML